LSTARLLSPALHINIRGSTLHLDIVVSRNLTRFFFETKHATDLQATPPRGVVICIPSSPSDLPISTMEDLLARHRKEARDLQSRVTQKKKQASKKTRKGVNDECDQLEAELRRRQAEEVTALQRGDDGGDVGVDGTEDSSSRLQDLTLQTDGDESNDDDDEQGEVSTDKPPASSENATNAPAAATSNGQSKKPNRAKARLARRAAEQEELIRQAKEEAQNLPDMKALERERMLSAMTERGLAEKVIRADGHCLYSAFADQLEQLDMPLEGGGGGSNTTANSSNGSEPAAYKIVRATAARYIEQHEDDFLPFLEEPLPEYLHKIRDTGEWGGQLELMALAKTYGVDINILQDFGRVEKIEGGRQEGGKDDERTMWLGYYKHGFGLGEHYNSLRRKGTS
jgi:OTU domain-containing protein 6